MYALFGLNTRYCPCKANFLESPTEFALFTGGDCWSPKSRDTPTFGDVICCQSSEFAKNVVLFSKLGFLEINKFDRIEWVMYLRGRYFVAALMSFQHKTESD